MLDKTDSKFSSAVVCLARSIFSFPNLVKLNFLKYAGCRSRKHIMRARNQHNRGLKIFHKIWKRVYIFIVLKLWVSQEMYPSLLYFLEKLWYCYVLLKMPNKVEKWQLLNLLRIHFLSFIFNGSAEESLFLKYPIVLVINTLLSFLCVWKQLGAKNVTFIVELF